MVLPRQLVVERYPAHLSAFANGENAGERLTADVGGAELVESSVSHVEDEGGTYAVVVRLQVRVSRDSGEREEERTITMFKCAAALPTNAAATAREVKRIVSRTGRCWNYLGTC